LEQVADFKSELAADIISEAVADLPRNQQSELPFDAGCDDPPYLLDRRMARLS
jgi:hypothetical protein